MRKRSKTHLRLVLKTFTPLLIICAAFSTSPAQAAPSAAPQRADLDNDGSTETVWLKPARQINLKQLCVAKSTGETLYCSPPAKIWKLLLTDIDNDGSTEIALALAAAKKERPGQANGLHIFKWNGQDLVPLWRGSSLSMPFRDVAFTDWNLDGRVELLSLETNTTTRRANLVIYRWTGFGFGASAIAPLPAGTTQLLLFTRDKNPSWIIKTKNGATLYCALSPAAKSSEPRRAARTTEMKFDCQRANDSPANEATAALNINAAQNRNGVSLK